jgi:polyisoprenyl-teichoic acid--peptidoglycan teichoic acid transferase
VFVAILLALAWAAIAFVSFHRAVAARNDALPPQVRAALAPADGPALATSHVTLLVGSDTSAYRSGGSGGTEGGRADTLLLVRTHAPSRTVSMLSIPRDLHVDIPGVGGDKINAAYAIGGLPLAIRTVRTVTGVDVNHVAQVDFDGFRGLVDELGGIEIDNPYMVRSGTPFDGRDWVFPRGTIRLDGRDALAYARIRKVDDRSLQLNEQEGTELGRIRRQQRVIDAIVTDIVSRDSLLRPRDMPQAMVRPLDTDVTSTQMLAFGFTKWWSKSQNSLRCRLGGDQVGDQLLPDERNRAVVRMFLGRQAPVPPDSALAPGCVRQGT